MSSFLRTIQKRAQRRNLNKAQIAELKAAKTQQTRITEAGYHTLRPTKGWIFISTKRLAAQYRMAQILGNVA